MEQIHQQRATVQSLQRRKENNEGANNCRNQYDDTAMQRKKLL
jgi:hypothetical protein